MFNEQSMMRIFLKWRLQKANVHRSRCTEFVRAYDWQKLNATDYEVYKYATAFALRAVICSAPEVDRGFFLSLFMIILRGDLLLSLSCLILI